MLFNDVDEIVNVLIGTVSACRTDDYFHAMVETSVDHGAEIFNVGLSWDGGGAEGELLRSAVCGAGVADYGCCAQRNAFVESSVGVAVAHTTDWSEYLDRRVCDDHGECLGSIEGLCRKEGAGRAGPRDLVCDRLAAGFIYTMRQRVKLSDTKITYEAERG